MIIDDMKNAGFYASLSKRISKALDYLRENDFVGISPGRYEIDGDKIFSMVMEYETKSEEESVWEAHKKYIDVQYIVRGSEKMGYADTGTLAVREQYDERRDCMFLEGNGGFLVCRQGTFVIFAPWDAHMPGLSVDGTQKVKKVVVKVLAE